MFEWNFILTLHQDIFCHYITIYAMKKNYFFIKLTFQRNRKRFKIITDILHTRTFRKIYCKRELTGSLNFVNVVLYFLCACKILMIV